MLYRRSLKTRPPRLRLTPARRLIYWRAVFLAVLNANHRLAVLGVTWRERADDAICPSPIDRRAQTFLRILDHAGDPSLFDSRHHQRRIEACLRLPS